MLRNYIGDRNFYRHTLKIAIPIIIQNGITNFVSLLDNIMIGQVGTLQMSGVSIVNQLFMVFMLCIFGLSTGTGIFTAQFHGSDDQEGIRYTVRFKLITCVTLTVGAIGVFLAFGAPLAGTFLTGEGDPADAAKILDYSMDYLQAILWGLIPFALSNVYASTLRECGQSFVPMIAGIVAVFVNLIGNFILIFGYLGLPAMGVVGAGIATSISRYVEFAIIAFWSHTHVKELPFIRGLYRSLHIPKQLFWRITTKATPLLVNEALWSFGVTFLNQCYSTCGLDVMSSLNITSTIDNLCSVVTMALANTLGIIMGQMLGASRPREELLQSNRKLIALAVSFGVVFGGILAALAGIFPSLYNTTDSVRNLATSLILIAALFKPLYTFSLAAYYTLRSGGKTIMTFLYDCGFTWILCVPLAFCLSRFTDLPIVPLYFICQLPHIIKCIIGRILVRKGTWIQTLTSK